MEVRVGARPDMCKLLGRIMDLRRAAMVLGEVGKRWITQSVVGVGVPRDRCRRKRHERSSGEKRLFAVCSEGGRHCVRDVRYTGSGRVELWLCAEVFAI